LDAPTYSVRINSPIYDSMTLNLASQQALDQTVNHTDGKSVHEIPMVCEYPDVFPNDLPGMPLDHDI
jgi:hypothetical protein